MHNQAPVRFIASTRSHVTHQLSQTSFPKALAPDNSSGCSLTDPMRHGQAAGANRLKILILLTHALMLAYTPRHWSDDLTKSHSRAALYNEEKADHDDERLEPGDTAYSCA